MPGFSLYDLGIVDEVALLSGLVSVAWPAIEA